MLTRWLAKMHQKPKAVRNQYAFLLTAGFVFIVGGIWTLTLPARLSNLVGDPTDSEVGATSRIPFGGVLAELKGQWSKLSASLPNAEKPEAPEEQVPTDPAEMDYPSEEVSTLPISEAKEILIATTSDSATTPSF